MKKRVLSIVLALVMAVTSLPALVFAENPQPDLQQYPTDTIKAHRDVSDEEIYLLTRSNSSTLKVGQEIAWLSADYTEEEFTSVGVPYNSGIVKIVEKSDIWEAYYLEHINFYLDVIKSGKGFDACMHGTLNKNVTEYNCYLGGVQHLIGTSYTFISKPFYSKVTFKLNIDGVPVSGKTVKLYDGKEFFPLIDNGNGVYSSDKIYIGDYSVYVNGNPVNLGVSVGEKSTKGYYYNDSNGEHIKTTSISEATAYYSGNEYEVIGNFYNYKISVKCDDTPADGLGKLSLVTNDHVYSLYKTGVGTYSGTLLLPKDIKSDDINIYIGNVKTDTVFQTTRALNEEYKNNDIEIHFYTAKVTALLDGTAMSGYTVSFDNGISQYYAKTNSSGEAELPVQILSGGGAAELPYTVKIDSVVDNTGEPTNLSSTCTTCALNYHTVSFFTGEKGKETLFRKQVVRDGSLPNKVANAPLDGYVFAFWSESQWEKDKDSSNITKYDFTQPIVASKSIYAHATKPTVDIYDVYIGTNISGTAIETTNPEAFRMPAVTITGFPKGNVLKCFNLELTNVKEVYFYNADGLIISQAGIDLSDDANGGKLTKANKVTVSFPQKASMTCVENYIRENVVFVPASDQKVTIKLTVSDDVISVEDTSTIEQSQCTDTSWTKLTDSAVGITLNGGKYYIDSDVTITGEVRNQKNDSAQPGITIQGAVFLYIPSDKTLTVTGSNGVGIMGGQAGILLLEGNVLNVYGGGTLKATGGYAGNGTNGENASRTIDAGNSITASAGRGGYGGGGAGAGIGTNGANASNNNPSKPSDKTYNYSGSGGNAAVGIKGNDGNSVSANIGTLYISNSIELIATGGAAGSGGQGGTMECFYITTHNSKTIVSGIIGGGGGGYGGQAGASVGQGGGSGGQGGSGAIGYLGSYSNYTDYSTTPHGGGGKGATDGQGKTDSWNDSTDKNGGNAGSNGIGGAEHTGYTYAPENMPGDVTYNIKFDGASGTESFDYGFVNGLIINSVPDYTSIPSGEQFMGWKVKTYGKTLGPESADNHLTTAENVLHQPNSTLTINPGTYGNIVLVPITAPLPANAASDELSLTTLGNTQRYDYTLKVTNNGQPADLGTFVFHGSDGKKYSVNSGIGNNIGTYTLTLASDTTISSISAIDLNNIVFKDDTGSSDLAIAKSEIKQATFASIEVAVIGKTVGEVKATGSSYTLTYNGSISTGNTSVFSYFAQQSGDGDTAEYAIAIDGEEIPTAIAKAKFGTRATVNYSTVNVTVNTNVNDALNLYLKNADGNKILLEQNGTSYSAISVSDGKEYTLFINDYETDTKVTLSEVVIDKTVDYYEINIVSRVDNVVNETNHEIKVNDVKAKTFDNTTFTAIALSTDTCTVKSNGVDVASVSPSTTLGTTYIDYYTVKYTTVDGVTGTVPVDDTLYLKNQTVTVAALDGLTASSDSQYVAAWTYNSNNYGQGDTVTVTEPIIFISLVKDSDLVIKYVDHYGDVGTDNKLPLTEKITIKEWPTLKSSFTDGTVKYNFKGWTLEGDPNKTIYSIGAETKFTPQGLLGGETKKDVTFKAVYDIEYLKDITISSALSNDSVTVLGLYEVGQEFTVNYQITSNAGINTMVLLPNYDKDRFEITSVRALDVDGLLGTVAENSGAYTITFSNKDTVYTSTGPVIVSIDYKVKSLVPSEYSFGFVLKYADNTLENITSDGRSYAYLGTEYKASQEVKIIADNSKLAIRILTPGNITIPENQVATYSGVKVVGSHKGETGDIHFEYNGYEKQSDCVQNQAAFEIKWYDSSDQLLTEAPTKAGVYKIGVSATASDFYGAVTEVKQEFTITPYAVTLANPTTELTYTGAGQTVSFAPTSPDNASDKLTQDDFTVTYYKKDDTSKTTPLTKVTDAGLYIFKAELKSGHANYSYDSSKEYEFAVTPKAVELIWATDDFTYNSKDQTASITAIYKDVLDNPHNLVVSVKQENSVTAFKNAGDYTAEVTGFDAADIGSSNYTLPAEKTKSYTMRPKAVTVLDASVQDKVYDGTTGGAVFTGDVLLEGLFVGDTLTISGIQGEYVSPNVSDSQKVKFTNNHTSWTLGGTSVSNYKLADSGHIEYAFGKITKAEQPSAPTAPTISGSSVIIAEADRTKNLEYCIDPTNPDDENSWISVPELDENGSFVLSGLSSGDHTIYLREKENNNYPASSHSNTSFTLTEFSVAYNANGGTGKIDSETAIAPNTITVKNGNALSRIGYTFAGWKDSAGTSRVAGETLSDGTTLYAQWTANSYTVHFNANGGSGSMEDQSFTYDVLQQLEDITFVKDGHTFTGWSTRVGGPILYSNKQEVTNLAGSGTVNLYANWAQNTYKITANITSPNNDNSVQIKLMRGNAVYAIANDIAMALDGTLYKGSKIFENIPAGTYNVEATQQVEGDKNVTLTKLIVISTNGAVDINLPASGVSSKLEVKKDALLTVAGGLDDEAEHNRQGGKDIIVKMTVEKKEEQQLSASADKDEKKTQDSIASIKATAGALSLEFMDIEIEKTTTDYYTNTSTTSIITETEKVLELIFSYEMNGKRNINIYRDHDGVASVFVELAERPADSNSYVDETFYVDKENNLIYVYAQRFSTYAIGYENEPSGGGGGIPPKSKKCPQDKTCVYAHFTDADTKAWYHDGVHFCVEKKYMVGVAEHLFDPEGTLSRGMIVTMLWRIEGSPASDYAMSFKDVPANLWYTEAIRWAQSNGVVLGYDEETFGPERDVTREQLAAILMRYANYKGINVSKRANLDKYSDKKQISDWALENIMWANAVGIIKGRTDTTIVPTGNATRAEAACMVQRFCENILK